MAGNKTETTNQSEAELSSAVIDQIVHHLEAIYQSILNPEAVLQLATDLLAIMRIDASSLVPPQHVNYWTEEDILVISYGDSLLREGELPLKTLKSFLDEYGEGLLTGIHILPFYPWSSDDGFAVLDYSSVNESLGSWRDIEAISRKYDLMADLVVNHCSSRSLWFQNFLRGSSPGKDYFFVADPQEDLSAVVRPRISPLLSKVETSEGTKYVWCTFGHDQVDFDFRNPEVLIQFVKIIRLYLDSGIRIFRLDAIAFLWKQPGTSCINLPQTHEVVRLMRSLIEYVRPDALLITETNIPNRENLSYFGNANEAHWVYNFSLPPLLLNSLVTGDSTHLRRWMMSMPPAQNGTAYFNFIASHDGLGLRPAEGLLSSAELDTFIEVMQGFGGHVSYRALDDGERRPYEVNIALYDALQGTRSGADQWQIERFVCAHAIMLGLEGIPAIYIHSLFGTNNDYKRVEHSGQHRSINRHQWDYEVLRAHLGADESNHGRIFRELKHLLALRRQQSAFHPNATQFTLQLGTAMFGYWRQSLDRRQSIFCVYNISDTPQFLRLSELNLIDSEDWRDLISGEAYPDSMMQLTLNPYQCLWISNSVPV